MSVSIGVATRDTVMTDPDAIDQARGSGALSSQNKGRNRIMTAQSFAPGARPASPR